MRLGTCLSISNGNNLSLVTGKLHRGVLIDLHYSRTNSALTFAIITCESSGIYSPNSGGHLFCFKWIAFMVPVLEANDELLYSVVGNLS